MKHLFVPYELALLAKEKGFDEPCLGWWCDKENLPVGQKVTLEDKEFGFCKNSDERFQYYSWKEMCTSPLYQQLVDWLRDKHFNLITIHANALGYYYRFDNTPNPSTWNTDRRFDGGDYKTYYEALESALTEAFRILTSITNENKL